MFDKDDKTWPRWSANTLIALIIALNFLGAWHWIRHNVVFLGHDATKYFQVSLQYSQILSRLAPQSIFQALNLESYRPPALFLWIQPFYALFGVSADSAQLANIVLFVATIFFTYQLGARVASQGVGLFAATLVGLLPMMVAMSRLLYTEMMLTALVTLNLMALLASQGFARWGWSLVWGASLGLGLLAKWTAPLYIFLPVLWCVWRAGFGSMQWSALRRPHLEWRAIGVTVAAAGVASGLWFLPNRSAAETLLLGWWLWPGWWIIMAALFYQWWIVWRRPSPLAHLWAALLLGALIASIWYLPHIDVFANLWALDEERGQHGASPFSPGNFWRYAEYFYWRHLGLLAFWLIIPAAIVLGMLKWRRLRGWRTPSLILWLAVLSGCLSLAALAQSNTRNLVPLLPCLAVLLALSLRGYAGNWPWLLGGSWIVILLVQALLFTVDGLYPLYRKTEGLWAQSYYLASPARGLTDRAYWIGPDLLQRVGAGANVPQRLALFVNTEQIHRGVLNNLLMLERLHRRGQEAAMIAITVNDITEEIENPWFPLLTAQWALLKDGDNRELEGSSRPFAQQLLAGDPLFTHLYREVHRYPLPNGETATLYHRTVGPGLPWTQYALLDESRAIADAARNAWSDHATLVYATNGLAVYVGLHGLPTERLVMLEDSTSQPVEAGAALAPHVGALLVVADAQAAERLRWLDEHAYHALALGSDFVGLDIYGRPSQPLREWPRLVAWPGLTLTALFSHDRVAPGQVLPVELTFAGEMDADQKVSIRLVDGQGAVVASNDQPVRPHVRLGLFAPPSTPPGEHRVLAILYHEPTLAAIATATGMDEIELLRIEVAPPGQP